MQKKKIRVQKADFYGDYFERSILNRLEKKYEVEISDKPDFLFYSVYRSGREHYQYNDCVKIFWSVEGVIPDFNECDYAIGSYPMEVGSRYLQVPYNPVTEQIQIREQFRDINLKNRKFCNFIYSNATNGNGAILRQEFCKELMKYKHVDCPGSVLNNMKDAIEPRNGKWYRGKVDFLKNYKFTIAFENISMPGMVTEKIIQAFEAGSIPIYWGDDAVTKLFNPKAFINCADYSSWEEVINRVKELDQNDDEYMQMILVPPANPDYDFQFDEKISNFIFTIIEKGNVPFEKDPLGWHAGSLAAKQLIGMEHNLFYRLYSKQQKVIQYMKKMLQKVGSKS